MQPNLRHVMLDLETLATSPDAAILSIGAVLFDPDQGRIANAEEGGTFYRVIDLGNSREPGVIDPRTVEWWMDQALKSPAAAEAVFKVGGRVELGAALGDFAAWLLSRGCTRESCREWRIWANDPDFDVTILASAYARYGIELPFSYKGSRSMRTLAELSGKFDLLGGYEPEPNECKHNALADAVYQARVVTVIMQALRRRVAGVKLADIEAGYEPPPAKFQSGGLVGGVVPPFDAFKGGRMG